MTDDREARAREIISRISAAKGWFDTGPAMTGVLEEALAVIQLLAAAEQQRDMPTIWEDPAGKGYPCFERPMTPKECSEALAGYEMRILELEQQRVPEGFVLVERADLEWIEMFAAVRAEDAQRVAAYRADWHARMGDVTVIDDAILALTPPTRTDADVRDAAIEECAQRAEYHLELAQDNLDCGYRPAHNAGAKEAARRILFEIRSLTNKEPTDER